MGFNEGHIILNSENGAYYPGQTVYGRIVFDQGKVKTIHGIYVSMKGYCKVHWTTQEHRRVNDRTENHTVNHSSYEEYVRRKIFVFGDADGEKQLPIGHHEFNFEFPLPSSCPSTFEGTYGHIRYRVKAVMLTSGVFSSNKEKKAAVRVIALTDLNHNPYCKEPIEFQIVQSYCCWCFNAGSSEVLVKLPVGGYCPGQVILIEVSCKNNSSVEISGITFAIKKEVRYIAESSPGTREEEDKVAIIRKGPVPGNTTRNWTIDMEVPAMDVYNLDACRFINIDYRFKVSTETSGCHTDEDESHPIIFGHIPLVGYQDNVQNPLQNQMPSQVLTVTSYPSPIVNQPLSKSPYPNSNSNDFHPNPMPYPIPNVSAVTFHNTAINSPYPNTAVNSPYPNPSVNSPYPNPPVKVPYPNSPVNSPYPNPPVYSPYPNPPYSTISHAIQYPTANTPKSSSPYPGINQGQTSVNAPYPVDNTPGHYSSSPVAPYPTKTSPMPPYPVSTPSMTSRSPLKTGTLGFTVTGDDSVTAPLLPPGANVPYPIKSASPYASASAPETSTPDSVDKIPVSTKSSDFTNDPPYNPDFINTQKKEEN